MLSDMLDRYKNILNSDLSFMRMYLIFVMFLMSIDYLLPSIVFNSNGYVIINKIFNEEQFAVLCLINVFFSTFALLYKEKTNLLIFLFDGVLSCFLWTSLSISLIHSYIFQNITLYPTIICASIASWWILIRYPWDGIITKKGSIK